MTTESTALAAAQDDSALAALYGDSDVNDGYSQAIGTDKIKLPRYVFNKQGLDESGTPFRKDWFYNSATQIQVPTIEAVLLYVHGWRAWSEYDDAEKKTNMICVSNDCQSGVMRHGDGGEETRRCRGCKDYDWQRTAKNKAFRNCSDRYTVLALDLATNEPFVMGFKKTSEPAIVQHVNKYHTNKRELSNGRKVNKPLCWHTVNMRLVMDKSGNFAVPVITPRMTSVINKLGQSVAEPKLNPPELVEPCLETVKVLRQVITHEVDDEDTSFDTADFAT